MKMLIAAGRGERRRGTHVADVDRMRLQTSVLLVSLLAGLSCRQIAGIKDPPASCSDPLQIDDMEDGDGFICQTDGRNGRWYTVKGNGANAMLDPVGQPFVPTRIPGGRGDSQFAARFEGSGFTDFAIMGFSLKSNGTSNVPIDVSNTGGISFWLKSNVAISVKFLTPETVTMANGGTCANDAHGTNCNNAYGFDITAPSPDWTHVSIPYSALVQRGGSANWNPQALLAVQFQVSPGTAPFDVWIDDVSFYFCSTSQCQPTCNDPAFPVHCPAPIPTDTPNRRVPAGCWPAGTECSDVIGWCADPLLIDDFEDGDSRICNTAGRDGSWFTVGDGPEGTLSPPQGSPALPSPLPMDSRGNSRFAAHFSASGFTGWGALIGFAFRTANDASATGGINFWMKSSAPWVSVEVPTPATVPVANRGACSTDSTPLDCNNHFQYQVAVPSTTSWYQYRVAYNSLRQDDVTSDGDGNLTWGSATFDPSRILGVQFSANAATPFDVWVDDVSFDGCSTSDCVPTCFDPTPVACPALGTTPAACWPAGTDCGTVAQRLRPGRWVLTSLAGAASDDIWATGIDLDQHVGRVVHWDGSTWSPLSDDGQAVLRGSWRAGADAWAVGDHGTVLSWDGNGWIPSSTGLTVPMSGVWGSSANNVWTVGGAGTILRWDGTSLSPLVVSGVTNGLSHVWGSSPDDVWIVGRAGTILHGSASTLAATSGATQNDLAGVWGSGPNDVWAVGAGGIIIHWDGSGLWKPVNSGTTHALNAVWGSSSDNVWAVGSGGVVVHWDGQAWSLVSSGVESPLLDVWGASSGDVWAVGGNILHWKGAGWSVLQ